MLSMSASAPRVARLGDRSGAVELHDRRPGEAAQLAVERGDLRPVLRIVGVQEAIAACST